MLSWVLSLPAIAQTPVSLGLTHSVVKPVRTSLGTPRYCVDSPCRFRTKMSRLPIPPPAGFEAKTLKFEPNSR